MFLKINGQVHYLGRAVDQDGDVFDILVQSRRDKKAAKKFFRKLLKGLRYVPRVLITDKLRSYSAARAEVMPSVEYIQQKYQNNHACAALSLGLRYRHVSLPAGATPLY